MKKMGLIRCLGLLAIGMTLSSTAVLSQDEEASADSTQETEQVNTAALAGIDANLGRQYFEGSKGFLNGGPACITCHNVNHKKLIPGGAFAKDLTDVYTRMGEGVKDWLVAPPFPAMAVSYEKHPLTERERVALTTFFKEASEEEAKPKEATAMTLFIVGGIAGFAAILILINILWWKRKKTMVKTDIFTRQAKAWDAKH